MTFTVVRAVRGANAAAAEPGDKLGRAIESRLPAPGRMDLPFTKDVLRLDLSDFAPTDPGPLE
jgi:hypothetical protein